MNQKGQAAPGAIAGLVVGVVVVVIVAAQLLSVGQETLGERLYRFENSLDNTGTMTLPVTVYDGVRSGTLRCSYDFSASTLLTVTVNGTVVENKTYTGSGTFENDVASLIQNGTNTVQVSVDNTERVNSIRTALSVTTRDVVGKETFTTASTITWAGLTLLAVAIIVMAASTILGMFRGSGGL